MRWRGRRESGNVEDRRGVPVRGLTMGGGFVGLAIVLVYLLLGGDPRGIQPPPGGGGGAPQAQRPQNAAEEELKNFVEVVLADTEDVWNVLFPEQLGRPYREPKLVLFTDRVRSGCGLASAGMGPFYCPLDEQVYLDLSFFGELKNRFGAPGDFAMAYVVAHEVGHHVQKQTGIMEEVHRRQQALDKAEANRLSVRLELQADFLAGVWAHHAQRSKQILESGDVEEALGAASAIGDDRIQKESQGYVVPDAFTHGTSTQRVRWFREGFQSGDVSRMTELFEMRYEEL